MKLAIMQPYFFPYVGYFQLINAVDEFIFYDDVMYIKKGWINRNQIIINKEPFLFTVPVKKASQNKKINETEIHPDSFHKWKEKFLKSLHSEYKKSINFRNALRIVEDVLETEAKSVADLAIASVLRVNTVLGLHKRFYRSSLLNLPNNSTGQNRIIQICKSRKANIYINPPGGIDLYSREQFIEENIELYFLKPNIFLYQQNSSRFYPNMSIIDVLMNCEWDFLRKKLCEFNLI